MDPLTASAFMGGAGGLTGGDSAPVGAPVTALADAGRGTMNFNAPSTANMVIVGTVVVSCFALYFLRGN